MAGVRSNDISPKPISKPRGLPDDVSFMTRFCSDYDGIDGYSHSWLSAAEVGEVQKWFDEHERRRDSFGPLFGYLFGNYIDTHLRYPEDCAELKKMGFEDSRIVFWYDN